MTTIRTTWMLAFSSLILFCATCDATPIIASATLDALQEPGPTSTSTALGAAVLSVEPTTGEFDFNLSITGIDPSDLLDLNLGSAISSIHLHNAPVGQNGPVVVDLGGGNTNANVTPFGNGGLSVNISGGFFGGILGNTLQQSNQNIAALFLEELYINVHTVDFPGGAIRGQLSIVQQPSTVPEPSSMLLGGLALTSATFGRARMRRRRR